MDRNDPLLVNGQEAAGKAEAFSGPAGNTTPIPQANRANGRRPGAVSAAILGAVLAGLALVALVALCLQAGSDGQAQPLNDDDQAKPPSPLFRNWEKPDLALVVSGQMHGYLQPCGCSTPQYGGLSRRFNFIKSLRDKGWPVVAVDLGDISSNNGPQSVLKYSTAMKALDLMGYTAIGLGKNEFYLSLMEVQGWGVNNDRLRILAANVSEAGIAASALADKQPPTVGVIGVIGPSIVKEVKKFPNIQFAKDNKDVILKHLTELGEKKPHLVVMLYQGTAKEAHSAAQFCAAVHKQNPKLPAVNVVLCLEEEEEPSGVPRHVGDTWILGIGHKGRYVGVIGAYRDQAKSKFNLKYQLVSIGPEYETPKGEKNNPVMDLMEDYSREVQKGRFLTQFPRTQHPVQLAFPNAKYIGSKRCNDCHEHAYEIWKESAHGKKAFQTLVDATRPSLRHFDGECVSCHTVGFNYQTGFADPGNTVRQNQKLVNVGCESCHGPCSVHDSNPQNPQIHALINPYKAKPGASKTAEVQRLNQLDRFCQKCHDIDNDVHWGKVPFHVKWVERKIIHMTPRKAAQAAPKGGEDK